MKYELILFDADDTLFDFKKAENYAFDKTFEELKIQYDREKCRIMYDEINKSLWKEFENGCITSEALRIERFERLFKKLNLIYDSTKASDLFVYYLSESSFIFKESLEILQHLHKKYKLAIITNGLSQVQNKRLKNSKISHFFDAYIISDDIKIAKPDPKIFEYALNIMNHKDKSTVLVVGDNLSSDIKGGINTHIDTCWFNINRCINHTDIKPTYEIHDLLDLKNIL